MISIAMLNVCSLPSKLDLPDFIDFIESHTINCFVETKINEIDVDNISIPVGYKGKFKCRKYCSKVKSGGMGIIYKGELEEFITEIKTDSDFVSWYRIDKTITGLSKDLLLGVVYIPENKVQNIQTFLLLKNANWNCWNFCHVMMHLFVCVAILMLELVIYVI